MQCELQSNIVSMSLSGLLKNDLLSREFVLNVKKIPNVHVISTLITKLHYKLCKLVE